MARAAEPTFSHPGHTFDEMAGNQEQEPGGGTEAQPKRVEVIPPPGLPQLANVAFFAMSAAAVVAWTITVLRAFDRAAHVDSIAGRLFNAPSAVQISQVADEAIVAVMPMVVLSLACSAGAVLAGLLWIGTRPRTS